MVTTLCPPRISTRHCSRTLYLLRIVIHDGLALVPVHNFQIVDYCSRTPEPSRYCLPTFRAARQKRVSDGVVEPVEHRDHAVESVVGEVSGRVHRRHEHLDEQVLLLAGYGVASPEWGGKGGSARVGDMEDRGRTSAHKHLNVQVMQFAR